MTEIRMKLFKKLCSIYDDKDFVIGVMSNVVTDKDSQALLDYIEDDKDVTIESIILLSLELGIESEKATPHGAEGKHHGNFAES